MRVPSWRVRARPPSGSRTPSVRATTRQARSRSDYVAAEPTSVMEPRSSHAAGGYALDDKRYGSSLIGRGVPRASLRERHGSQRAAQASGHDAHVGRVEGSRLREPDGTRASRPVDAPPAQAMGGNDCRRERDWTDRRTLRSFAEGHGGNVQPADRSAHRPCWRQPELRRASNLHPRRAYASTLSPWQDGSSTLPRQAQVPSPGMDEKRHFAWNVMTEQPLAPK
jgi:hypothetical protein